MNKCLGCGKELKEHELENRICERCFKLKNYGEYKIVEQDNEEYHENQTEDG